MIRDDGYFTVISERNSVLLLVTLNGFDEPLRFNDLRKYVNSNKAVGEFLDRAEGEGLIDLRVETSPHRTFFVTLTPMGKEVATMLGLLDSIISPGEPLKGKSINQRFADPILRRLNSAGMLNQQSLLEIAGSYRSMKAVVGSMIEEGLVHFEESSEDKRHYEYTLTPLGKQVAGTLDIIYKRIVSQRPKEK